MENGDSASDKKETDVGNKSISYKTGHIVPFFDRISLLLRSVPEGVWRKITVRNLNAEAQKVKEGGLPWRNG